MYPPNFIGGAELIAHQQSLALTKLGHEIQVFTGDTQVVGARHSCREELYQNIRVNRVYLTKIDYDPDYVSFSHPEVEKHFIQLLREFHPDIVHFHNIIGLSVKILRIAHEFGVKTILTLHDHWGFCFKNTIMKHEGVICENYSRCEECQPFINDGMERRIPMRLRQDCLKLMMNEVDFFISPSHYLFNTYLIAGFDYKKMNIIWNGIDFDRFNAIKKKSYDRILRFSFFGYFGRHKGVSTLLDALPKLNNQKYFQINLIGDGEEKSSYQEQLIKNGFTNFVKFFGKLDNSQIHKAYAETDVLILPSIWRENQPVSITEAMAAGIPVIASNIGGIPEIVENNKTGLIFEAGNSQDLANKMDFLIDHPELLETFGEAAREKMRSNTFESQANKLLELYNRALEKNYNSNQNDAKLVICIGSHFSSKSIMAIRLLSHYLNNSPPPQIVMANWITEQQRNEAKLIWVIDPNISITEVQKFLHLGCPLLIPEEHKYLVYLCRIKKFGLYYHDEHEAAACISYFLRNLNDL